MVGGRRLRAKREKEVAFAQEGRLLYLESTLIPRIILQIFEQYQFNDISNDIVQNRILPLANAKEGFPGWKPGW
jgi:hypothetical protein